MDKNDERAKPENCLCVSGTSAIHSGRLIRRAALLRLLAAGFLYPDAALKQRLLQDIAAMPAGDAAASALAALERAWSMADEESLMEEYSRLFIGGDAVVLHETTYSGTGRSTELADINGFYLAFDFDLRARQHEVADHLGVELEFYSLLLLKQAYALEQGWQDKFEITRDAALLLKQEYPLEQGWQDKFEITRDAAKAFLADHLGRWVERVRERAAARQAAPVYQALFEAAAAAVQRECQTLAVRPRR